MNVIFDCAGRCSGWVRGAVLLLMVGWCGCSVQPPGGVRVGPPASGPVPDTPFVMIVDAGGLDPDLLRDAVSESARHTGMRLHAERVEPLRLPRRGDARDLAQGFSAPRDGRVLTVLLVSLGAPRNDLHLALNRSAAAAVIDLALLRDEDPRIERLRIERQLTRALAFSLGLPASPDFYCVTWGYGTLKQLDGMGRNFNPVTAHQFRQAAIEAGWLTPQPAPERKIGVELD